MMLKLFKKPNKQTKDLVTNKATSIFAKNKPIHNKQKKVVVIGSGISGLSSAWLLHQSGNYDVTLLEADNRYGGHANAVEIAIKERETRLSAKKTLKKAKVDTGFLVFNHKTYPHLTHFFHHLNVRISQSDMSFGLSVSKPSCGGILNDRIEWSGTGLKGVFAQKRRMFSASHLRMVYDILRMQKQADALLTEAKQTQCTLGELLHKHGYSKAFRDHYLLPMAAAIWSTSVDDILDFPAATFLTFCQNHVLLNISGRPDWKTVANTSAQYVEKVIAALPDTRINHKVIDITNTNNGQLPSHEILMKTPQGEEKIMADIVILACHSDQAASIVKNVATASQLSVLNDVTYAPNTAYLHTDKAQMPSNKKVWSSWNYLARNTKTQQRDNQQKAQPAVTVSYWLNKLQPFLPFQTNVFVTLNPITPIKKNKVLASFSYAHPQMNHKTIAAQQRLPIVQGDNNLYFAGAWTRYGFHEDGIWSAVNVAKLLEVTTPWKVPTDYDARYADYAAKLNQHIGDAS